VEAEAQTASGGQNVQRAVSAENDAGRSMSPAM